MRKIETKMLDAIKDGEFMLSGNTQVRLLWANPDGTHCCEVSLHGNDIATVYAFTIGDETSLFAVPNLNTLNEYPTATTKSRLRALGVTVWTQNGVTFVTVPNPTNPLTYWIEGVDQKGQSGVKVGAGQRAYHRALCEVRVQHERDRRKRKCQPFLINVAQDLVINSDLVEGEQA